MAFKICAIGCGAMATTGHGPSFQRYAQEHPDTELVACCDLDAEKAELYRGRTREHPDPLYGRWPARTGTRRHQMW